VEAAIEAAIKDLANLKKHRNKNKNKKNRLTAGQILIDCVEQRTDTGTACVVSALLNAPPRGGVKLPRRGGPTD
jgi:hypothetical protein